MDPSRLDAQLLTQGWGYDNGWRHDDVPWDCYVDSRYGVSEPYFVILAQGGRACVLRLDGGLKEQLWTGPLENETDVATLLKNIPS